MKPLINRDPDERKQQALVRQALVDQHQAHLQINSTWLDHPVTRVKLKLLEDKHAELVSRAQAATSDVTRHSQCLQYLTESHNIKQIINILKEP